MGKIANLHKFKMAVLPIYLVILYAQTPNFWYK